MNKAARLTPIHYRSAGRSFRPSRRSLPYWLIRLRLFWLIPVAFFLLVGWAA